MADLVHFRRNAVLVAAITTVAALSPHRPYPHSPSMAPSSAPWLTNPAPLFRAPP